MFDSTSTAHFAAIKRAIATIAMTAAMVVLCISVFGTVYLDEVKAYAAEYDDAQTVAQDEGNNIEDFLLSAQNGSLTIFNVMTINVVRYGKENEYKMTEGTVEDLLSSAQIELAEDDYISYALGTRLFDGMSIVIEKLTYVTVTEIEQIKCKTVTKKDSTLNEGTTKTTKGTNGVKEVTYRCAMLDGEVIERTAIETKVIKEAVDTVKIVGTKVKTYKSSGKYVSSLSMPKSLEFDSNGRPVSYKKLITGTASAYSGGGYTATGAKARTGYVAVNPRQIPYGTKLFIRCADGSYIYGYAVAKDTGGFVKWGTRVIDLYFDTERECEIFGLRKVEIYVL